MSYDKTILSLFARARLIPHFNAINEGVRPLAPAMPLTTISALVSLKNFSNKA